MRKFLIFLSCTLLLFGRVAAQNHTITGTILDANGSPVAGASVTVKGTTMGTSTGADGSFVLHTTDEVRTLVVSAINFTTQEINVGGKSKVFVNLQTASKNLSEVVVVAYGTQKKTNVTGAIATVSGATVADKPFTSVDKALQGDVAGVQVSSTSGAPGSATDIRIRGIGSINASAAPLWVIDGVISTTSDLTQNTTTANPLSTLNPDDIESISVLKDAAATAPYGSRGANGVIIVTTKKGKVGKTRFSIVGEFGQNSRAYNPSNKPENSLQLQTTFRQALINAGAATDNASADQYITNNYGYPANYTSTNTNWFKTISQNGPQSQVNMSLVLRHSIADLQNGFRAVGQLALRKLLLYLLGQLPDRGSQLARTQHALHVTDDRVDGPPRRRAVGQHSPRAIGNFGIRQFAFQFTEAGCVPSVSGGQQ